MPSNDHEPSRHPDLRLRKYNSTLCSRPTTAAYRGASETPDADQVRSECATVAVTHWRSRPVAILVSGSPAHCLCGSLSLAHCLWLTVFGSLSLAHCLWHTVSGSLSLWLTVSGSLSLAHCLWLTVSGSLCLAHCVWLTVSGSLSLAHSL